jgi:hypothetical protein
MAKWESVIDNSVREDMAEAREAVKSVMHAALLCLFIRLCPFGVASGARIRVVCNHRNTTCVRLQGVKKRHMITLLCDKPPHLPLAFHP